MSSHSLRLEGPLTDDAISAGNRIEHRWGKDGPNDPYDILLSFTAGDPSKEKYAKSRHN